MCCITLHVCCGQIQCKSFGMLFRSSSRDLGMSINKGVPSKRMNHHDLHFSKSWPLLAIHWCFFFAFFLLSVLPCLRYQWDYCNFCTLLTQRTSTDSLTTYFKKIRKYPNFCFASQCSWEENICCIMCFTTFLTWFWCAPDLPAELFASWYLARTETLVDLP